MTPDEAKKAFGSGTQVCEALGLGRGNWTRWNREGIIPIKHQAELAKIKPQLQVDDLSQYNSMVEARQKARAPRFKEGDYVYWIGQNQSSDQFGVYPLELVIKREKLVKVYKEGEVTHGRFVTKNFSFQEHEIYKTKSKAIQSLIRQIRRIKDSKNKQE